MIVFSYREDRRLSKGDVGMTAMKQLEAAERWTQLHETDVFAPMEIERDIGNRIFAYRVCDKSLGEKTKSTDFLKIYE